MKKHTSEGKKPRDGEFELFNILQTNRLMLIFTEYLVAVTYLQTSFLNVKMQLLLPKSAWGGTQGIWFLALSFLCEASVAHQWGKLSTKITANTPA